MVASTLNTLCKTWLDSAFSRLYDSSHAYQHVISWQKHLLLQEYPLHFLLKQLHLLQQSLQQDISLFLPIELELSNAEFLVPFLQKWRRLFEKTYTELRHSLEPLCVVAEPEPVFSLREFFTLWVERAESTYLHMLNDPEYQKLWAHFVHLCCDSISSRGKRVE